MSEPTTSERARELTGQVVEALDLMALSIGQAAELSGVIIAALTAERKDALDEACERVESTWRGGGRLDNILAAVKGDDHDEP